MLKRTHIINYIAETLNLTDYLEIGLGDGLNFSSIILLCVKFSDSVRSENSLSPVF